MALKYLDGGRITGLSTDVKPTDIPTGSSFVETDSGAKLVYNGTTWIYDTFDSINDALGKSGGVTQRQHFVEWFSGAVLNTDRWTYATITGSPTSAMGDSVNGGYQITGTANNDASQITLNGRTQFSNSSVFIMVAKKDQSAANINGGLRSTSGATLHPPSSVAHVYNGSYTNITLVTGDASTTSTADSGVAQDQAWHNYKIEMNGNSGPTIFTLDGVLKNTKTTNIPTDGYSYQPGICFQQRSVTNANGNFLYCEAWNT